jgi:hypothetical protein
MDDYPFITCHRINSICAITFLSYLAIHVSYRERFAHEWKLNFFSCVVRMELTMNYAVFIIYIPFHTLFISLLSIRFIIELLLNLFIASRLRPSWLQPYTYYTCQWLV